MTGSEPIQLILIDDSQTFLNAALHYLQRQPQVKVLAAETRVPPALRLAETLQPDLILLDLDLPEVNGWEAIPRFHQIDPALPVIVLSVLDSACERQAALQAGAACFIVKQDMHNELMPAIQRYSTGRSMPSSGDSPLSM